MKRLIGCLVLLLLFGCADPDPYLSEGRVVGRSYVPAREHAHQGSCIYRDPNTAVCYGYDYYTHHHPEQFLVIIEGAATDKEGNSKTYRQEREVYQALYDSCHAGMKWQETSDGAECISQ